MPINILMPALSPTMEVGTLTKWFVKVGDKVKSGDILAEIETDKATMEFESVEDGVISEILVSDGSEGIEINSIIATMESEIEIISPKVEAQIDKIDDDKIDREKERPSFNTVKSNPQLEPVSSISAESSKKISVREAIREAMFEEMTEDENVFLIGEEVAEYQGAYKVSQGLVEQFGSRRVIDTPITEHGFTGLAIGAAFAGLKPIVEFMTFNFAMQAIDQIVNSAAKTRYMSGGQMTCPIVFRGPNGAAARVGAQHSQDYASWFASIPGLKVIQPYSAVDAKGLLKSAIRDPNPVIFLENEILYGETFEVSSEENNSIPIGKAKIVRNGQDVTLVSFGIGMKHTIAAAQLLEKENISCEIVDLRSLRPLDKATVINSVKKTNRCVTVEEGFPVCSIGNHISALLMENVFDYLDAPVINCSGKDVPMPYAANLEKEALINAELVTSAVKKLF